MLMSLRKHTCPGMEKMMIVPSRFTRKNCLPPVCPKKSWSKEVMLLELTMSVSAITSVAFAAHEL